MGNWKNVTLGDIGKALSRYRPFIAVIAGVFVIAAFLPGRGQKNDEQNVAANDQPAQGNVAPGTAGNNGQPGATTDSTIAGTSGPGGTTSGGTTATGGRTPGSSGGGATPGAAAGGTSPQGGGQLPVAGEVGPDCDKATGRIKVPSRYAPPCAPPYRGANNGATSPGVTANAVTVVWYQPKSNPAADAALRAAGAAESVEDVEATVKQFFEYFNAHYEAYGRKVNMKFVKGSADAGDDATGRANATEVVDSHHPFLVIGAPNNGFVDVLARNKVVCICTVSQPQEFYEKYSPYVGYTTLMSSTQGYIHRAEYVGKRLKGGLAKWAGTRDGVPQNTEQRLFALLWYETDDHAYAAGVDFFKKELANKYGVTLKDDISYKGYPDVTATQDQARPHISRLKSKNINSLIFSGDPIAPAIFTSEASRQQWFPEWIITGSALVDTTLFARTYDPTQWKNAFGISYLVARSDPHLADAWRLMLWHNGQEPVAKNQFGILYAPVFITFTGIHMAGPTLTPQTFQQGLFKYPVTGQGSLTTPTTSWGNHGIWPFVDYTQFDDITEIWWDPTVQGQDEAGHQGQGMYEYVNGGKRFMPGQQPTGEPKAFEKAGAVFWYDKIPASDVPPNYPRDQSTDRKY